MELMEATPFEPYVEVQGSSRGKYAKLIKAAYEKALTEESNLPDWILTLNGMSGKRYRHFVNNLIATVPDVRYLEVGSWKGSTAMVLLSMVTKYLQCVLITGLSLVMYVKSFVIMLSDALMRIHN